MTSCLPLDRFGGFHRFGLLPLCGLDNSVSQSPAAVNNTVSESTVAFCFSPSFRIRTRSKMRASDRFLLPVHEFHWLSPKELLVLTLGRRWRPPTPLLLKLYPSPIPIPVASSPLSVVIRVLLTWLPSSVRTGTTRSCGALRVFQGPGIKRLNLYGHLLLWRRRLTSIKGQNYCS